MVVYSYFDAECTHFIIKGLGISNMPIEFEILRYNKFSNPLILNVIRNKDTNIYLKYMF